MEQKYRGFFDHIKYEIPNTRIFTDSLHTLAYGSDASFYRLIPQIVIKVINEGEVALVLKYASSYNLSVTFRAAGTSLSGQAISDSILVICTFGFQNIQINKDGTLIKLDPGVIGQNANNALKVLNKKIGPDPASINAAAIGGIVANNASGMCCGIEQNSYNTLASIRVVFQNGSILDTSDLNSIEKFKEENEIFILGIMDLAKEIKNNKDLYEKIKKKYSIKNTTGYSLNALIDFEDPIDIISHLMIGSEGTLGFISSVTLKTVNEFQFKASALILFNNMYEACKFVTLLKKQKNLVNAAELMDRASLRSVENKDGIDDTLKTLDENVAAILVECGDMSNENLDHKIEEVTRLASQYNIVKEVEFFKKPSDYSKLWAIRKGTFPTVGAMRESGTTTIIEDVAFNIEDLADGILALQSLFYKYSYNEAIIFGHALEGNIHFVFNQAFEDNEEITRYENFMNEVCDLVANTYKGSLKAEHGTGRNMAPFVEMEWGNDAYKLMEKIKDLFDPKNLLNPGVILNNDKKIHIKNLKFMAAFNPLADKCIECGFCEPICPSKNLSLTPRQRIVVQREIQRKKNHHEDSSELEKLYVYDGEQTCAVDGLCATLCPVDIDTGALTKKLRQKHDHSVTNKIAGVMANNFKYTLLGAKSGFYFLNYVEKILSPKTLRNLRNLIPIFPYWLDSMPRVAQYKKSNESNYNTKIIYFSSCVNRLFGNDKRSKDTRDLNKVVESICKKAQIGLKYINKDSHLCCGVPFESKGFKDFADKKLNELLDVFEEVSESGKYPILCDNSPCNYRIVKGLQERNLIVYEPIEFALKYVIPNVEIKKSTEAITIHTTCSSKKMSLDSKFLELANLLSTKVIVPNNIDCCGFAGDRGFSYPELNEKALSGLRKQIEGKAMHGYSTSKTCEIGLSHHGKVEYSSILYLLDQCSNE